MNLVSVIAEQGLLLVFANVLLQQLGVPIPAEPTLVVAGGLQAWIDAGFEADAR